jgi:hypothetical protein
LSLFTSKGRTTSESFSEEKKVVDMYTARRKKGKNGPSTVAFHPTKGEIMIEGKMTEEEEAMQIASSEPS